MKTLLVALVRFVPGLLCLVLFLLSTFSVSFLISGLVLVLLAMREDSRLDRGALLVTFSLVCGLAIFMYSVVNTPPVYTDAIVVTALLIVVSYYLLLVARDVVSKRQTGKS